MADTAHNPDDRSSWPELGEPLRWAVEAVRQSPPPPDAVNRAVVRALQIDRVGRPWNGRSMPLFATGALVALLLLGLGLRCTYPPGGYVAGTHTRGAGARDGTMGVARAGGAAAMEKGWEDAEGQGNLLREQGDSDGLMLVGLGHLGSHWEYWEHLEPARDLMNDLPPIDRRSVELYLSNQPDGGRRWGPRRAAMRGQIDSWVGKTLARRTLLALLAACDEASLALPDARPRKGGTSNKRRLLDETLGEASRREREGDREGAVRALTALAAQDPGNAVIGRLVGHRLLALGQPALAAQLFGVVVTEKPTDAASHRALAWALDDAGRPGLAALHFEVALALLGRQGGGGPAAVREEYGQMLRRALRDQRLPERLRRHLAMRWFEVAAPTPAALRVTSTCSANVEVVLLIIEPGGTRREIVTFRQDDQGPRIYQVRRAKAGEYEVQVRLGEKVPATDREACVRVEIEIRSSQAAEPARRTIVLDKPGQLVRVARVKH
jgi:hypothetical protein